MQKIYFADWSENIEEEYVTFERNEDYSRHNRYFIQSKYACNCTKFYSIIISYYIFDGELKGH